MESTFRGPLAPGYCDIFYLTANSRRVYAAPIGFAALPGRIPASHVKSNAHRTVDSSEATAIVTFAPYHLPSLYSLKPSTNCLNELGLY